MKNIKGFKDADVNYFDEINNLEHGGYLIEVPANSEKGFKYPYLLFVPTNVNINSTIIVEPSNSIRAVNICGEEYINSSLKKSIDEVKEYFFAGHPIKRINERTTNYPFLYPLFPRIVYQNEIYYNHMLSSNSMDENKSEVLNKLNIYRTDLQLIEMIKDASERLKEYGINIDEKVILYGFSASAKFVNRFTLLHPEIVKYAFAAGMGGTVTLPLKELNGKKLIWPIGLADMKEIDDEKLNLYRQVPQFYYQGIKDPVDSYQPDEDGTCKNKGILSDEEANILYKLLGKNMNEDRWSKTIEIINKLDYDITLKSFDDVHRPHMLNDIIEEKLTELQNQKKL